MNVLNILKNNAKFYIILGIIILLGTIGITVAITMNEFNAIAVNTTTSIIDANITYDEGTNTAEIINNGNLLPIDDTLVTLDTIDERVLKVKFNVSGIDSNPNNTIYDIAMYFDELDCQLRTTDLKWRLYKNNSLLSEGNLSPTFDTINNNRLVLTNTQEDLTTTVDKYTFLLWISESCTGNISECASSMDQSELLNKTLKGTIKVELSTKTKKTLTRITGEEGSCDYTEIEIPSCNNITYNGTEQQLVELNSNYLTINNAGTNAGSYNVILDLNDGCKWNDGNSEDRVMSCNINKYDVEITTKDQNITYGNQIANTDNYIAIGDLVNGHSLTDYKLQSNIYDVGTDVINVSNIIIKDSLGNDVTNNYNFKYNKGTITVECLNKAKLPNINDIRYSGLQQTGVTGGEFVTISGPKSATEMGNYIIKVTPQKNYCWADGSAETKELTWKIISDIIIVSLNSDGSDVQGTTSLYNKNNRLYLDDTLINEMTEEDNNIEIPTKIGYTFNGYYTGEKGSGTLMINSDGYATEEFLNTEYTDNITLYANWNVNVYNINYHENANYMSGDDTLIVTLNGRSFYKENDEAALVAYAYDGIYTGPVLVGTSKAAVSYYQTYNSSIIREGGSFEYNGTTYYYSFADYWMEGNYTNSSETNITKKILTTNTITKDVAMLLLEENVSTSSQSFVYGVSQNLKANPYVKQGYSFAGWSTTPTGEVEFTDEESVINLTSKNGETIDLYAIWKDISGPTIQLGSISTLPNIINIPITTNKDIGSGILSTTCEYKKTNGSYSSTNVTVNNSSCRIIELDPNTTYDYKVCSYDRVGNESCITGTKKTNEIAMARINADSNVTHYSYYNYSNYGAAGDGQTIYLSTNGNQAFLRTVSPGVSGVKGHKIYGYTMMQKFESSLSPMLYIYSAADLSAWPSATTNCVARDTTTPAGTWAKMGCVVTAGYDYISVVQFAQGNGSGTGTIYYSWFFLLDLTDYFGAGNEPSDAWCNKWINDTSITITYDANGGYGAPDSQIKSRDVALTLSSTIPIRAGYKFNGWKDSNGNSYSAGGTYTSNTSTTMTAQWIPDTYTITYNANGGSGAPSSQTKTHGVTLTLSSTIPTKPGNSFLGWSTSQGAESATWPAGGSFTTNGNVTLYAVWQELDSEIIAWRANSGEHLSSGELANQWISFRFSAAPSSIVSYIQYCIDTTNTCTPNTTYTGDNYISSNSYIRYRAIAKDGTVEATESFYGLVSAPPSSDTSPPTNITYTAYYSNNSNNLYNGGWASTANAIWTRVCATDYQSSITSIQYASSNTSSSWSTMGFNKGSLTETSTGSGVWCGVEPWSAYTRNSTYYFRACSSGGCTSGTTNPSFTVKYDGTAPTCSISVVPNGTLAANVTLTYNDEHSGVGNYGLTTSSTATYNSTTTLNDRSIFEGKVYYGYVRDNVGNTGSCSYEITRIITNCQCNISDSVTGSVLASSCATCAQACENAGKTYNSCTIRIE